MVASPPGRSLVSRNSHRLPSSRVLKACRCLGGIRNQGNLPSAVRIVSAAMHAGVTMPRSAVLDLARVVLDSEIAINRDTRLAASKALARFNEREIVRRATRAIRDPASRLDVVMAAATILLGSPNRSLSHPTLTCLTRKVCRFGQIRGPLVDLLHSRRSPVSKNERLKK